MRWIALCAFSVTLTADPLPSWHEGPSKLAITQFVASVTTPGKSFISINERIAVFDIRRYTLGRTANIFSTSVHH